MVFVLPLHLSTSLFLLYRNLLLLRFFKLLVMGNVFSDSLSLIVASNAPLPLIPANATPRKYTKCLLFIGENVIIHPDFYSFNSALIAYLQSVEVYKSLDCLDFMERIFEGENSAEKHVTYSTLQQN